MDAVILAGGLGTRLRGEVPDRPKPLAPVKGRPFLAYLLDYWKKQGVRRFVLATGYKHEAFESCLGREYAGASIDYSTEPEPMGTGGGLMLALAQLGGGGEVLVLNGDTFFEVPLDRLTEFYRQVKADICLAVQRRTEAGRYESVVTDPELRVTALKPRAEEQPEAFVNGGVYLMGLDFLRGAAETLRGRASLETEYFPRWIAQGARVFAFPCRGRFIDIGTPDSYRAAPEVLETDRREER